MPGICHFVHTQTYKYLYIIYLLQIECQCQLSNFGQNNLAFILWYDFFVNSYKIAIKKKLHTLFSFQAIYGFFTTIWLLLNKKNTYPCSPCGWLETCLGKFPTRWEFSAFSLRSTLAAAPTPYVMLAAEPWGRIRGFWLSTKTAHLGDVVFPTKKTWKSVSGCEFERVKKEKSYCVVLFYGLLMIPQKILMM